MDPSKDAFGQEMWAYLQGQKSYEIIERDDGYIDLSEGAPAYFAEFSDWPEIQRKAIKYVKGKILDVGAGAGRVSLYLQEQGFEVMAIDNSPLAIRVCAERGVKEHEVLPIEEVGMIRSKPFDTIIMFGNNFGLFGARKKAQLILETFHQITSPRAQIITENIDPYRTDDPVHLQYHIFNKERGRMPGQLRIRVRFRNYIGDWFDYLLVSKEELKEILEGTGWQVKNFIDSGNTAYSAIIEKEGFN